MLRLSLLLSVCAFSSLAFAGNDFSVNVGEFKTSEGMYSTIEISGAFLDNSGDQVAQAILKAPHQNIVIDLQSPGGRGKEAEKMKAAMDEARAQGKSIATLVANGRSCESACTLVYMHADRRIAAATAVFMFHAVQKEDFRGVIDTFQNNVMLNYYAARGISKEWLQERRVEEVFSGVNDYYISGKDAVSEKTGIVTELWSPIVQHTRAPIDLQIRPR